MIIPGPRIIPLFAFTVIPASIADAVMATGVDFSVAALVLVSVVAAADALAAIRRMKGITVAFPERVNLTRGREAALDFRIASAVTPGLELLVGLVMPPSIASSRESVTVRTSAGSRETAASWPVIASERGVHYLEGCRVRTLSPLRLWWVQSAFRAATRLHVYPALQEERKKLASLLLRRSDMRVRPQRQLGQGREFEKLRTYLPGDSLGDIHWKATAKRGHPVTKEYQIERTQEVYCIIDASRLSARMTADGKGEKADGLLESFISASLLLATVARRQGDLFGVMAFSDSPLTFIRAKGGTGHFGACREALSGIRSSLVTPNFEEAAVFLASRLRRRALLMFLTSLDEPVLAENFARSIRVLSRRHLVLVNAVKPPMAHPLFSEDGVKSPDDVYARLGGHLVWHGLRQTREALRLNGVDLSLAENDRFCATLVTRYLNVKRRQML